MTEHPLVSIVIPVYNGANYLREAIDSALAQTYDNCEVIVVNDGSRDDGETERIALSYGDRIRYFHKENGGVSSALNRGIEEMRGDFFSWLSHDDLYYPQKVERNVAFLASMGFPEDVIPYSDCDQIDGEGKLLRSCVSKQVQPEEFILHLLMDPDLHGCSLLIPRKAFNEFGLFSLEDRYTQDYTLWFKMAGKYRFLKMPEVLVRGRVHCKQQTFHSAFAQAHFDFKMRESNRFLDGGMRRVLGCGPIRAYIHSLRFAYALRSTPGLVTRSFLRRLGIAQPSFAFYRVLRKIMEVFG